MRTINVNEFTTRPVPLGRQGENEVTQVLIPVTDITTEFGNSGSFTLVVRRSGDTLIYPPGRVTWDDDTVTWTLTATDTAKSGRGKFGLRYAVGDKVKWSQIWESYVEPTLDMEEEEQPDAYTSFLAELAERTAQLHQDIEGITDEAEGYAEAAAASAASITLPLPITSGGTGQTTADAAAAALGLGTLIDMRLSVEENLEDVQYFDVTYDEGTYIILVENLSAENSSSPGPGLFLLGLHSNANWYTYPLAEIKSCYMVSVAVESWAGDKSSVTLRFTKYTAYPQRYFDTRVIALKLF